MSQRPDLRLVYNRDEGETEVASISPIERIKTVYPGLAEDEDFVAVWADKHTRSVEIYPAIDGYEIATYYTCVPKAAEDWMLTVAPDQGNLWYVVSSAVAD